MSILLEEESGWFVNYKDYFDKIYKVCYDENSTECEFKLRSEFFRIKTPFVMKSHAIKVSKNLQDEQVPNAQKKKPKKRSKKRNEPLAETNLENRLIYEKVTNLIENARNLSILKSSEISAQEWFENNSEAREAAKGVLHLAIDNASPSKFHNNHNLSCIKTFGSEMYVIPPQSIFHLCDIGDIVNLKGYKYDLIVLDPPWENKSVRRNKRYETLCCESLMSLPIEDLSHPGSLIVMWMTNNIRQLNYIKEVLFPKWKVYNPVTWHWVKITEGGHLVHPIDWHHKKPYENLMLGRVSESESSNSTNIKGIEQNKIILSIPSSIHSHKPPLVEILKPYIPEDAKCLELFARYLLPNWTSLGNEVLKLQNVKLFERIR
ncbi:N(6)-adenine-specific methyltransferase METTL4-like isoform X2 [Argiope bruennichi]|uniref:N(6)-adenine-specific methyltransferase METTL4-like isoform X2 n=1 Tax=Argiope bruennichi TaxID=94029 RepID=UPI0024942F3C|nr:N(6)-adenine-specific methyltransferase METTL4-like isoform X2 [Argiope bruennichi]